MYQSIGILGCGTIGSHLFHTFRDDPDIRVSFLCDTDPDRMAGLDAELARSSPGDLTGTDLVIEVAVPEVIARYGPDILNRTNLLMFSVTALADSDLLQTLLDTCERTGNVLYLPHGAVAGIDGLQDGRGMLTGVSITTTKSPKSLGRSDDERTLVFEGPTREICTLYPRNVNVHAVTALAGLGMDRTRSRLVSDPSATTNTHVIEASGEGIRLRFEIESPSSGGVTGLYTPESAAGVVSRICRGAQGMVML